MFDVPFYIAEEYLYNNRVYKGKYPISIVETSCETDDIFKSDASIIEELDEDEIFKYNVNDLTAAAFLPFQTQDLNKKKYSELEKKQQSKNLNLYENPQKRYNDYNEIVGEFSEKQKKQREQDRERFKKRPEEKRPTEINQSTAKKVEAAKKVEVAEKNANKNLKKEKQRKKKERERQTKLAKKR
jgi:hypothetical protein